MKIGNTELSKVLSTPMPTRKAGQKAMIYGKPLTGDDREGIATLKELISRDKLTERWIVEFENGDMVTRTIIKLL